MKRILHRLTHMSAGAAIALLLLSGTAVAGSYLAIAEFGVRYIGRSSLPTNCTSGRTCTHVDTSTTPQLKYYDGTTDNFTAACLPTTTGDYCGWDAVNGRWTREPAPTGGGGGGTLSSSYNASATTGNTITETSAGGEVAFKAYAGQTGHMLSVYASGGARNGGVDVGGVFTGASFSDVSGATGINTGGGTALTATSAQLEATGPAFILNTANAYTAATNGMLEIESNHKQAFEFLAGGANMYFTAYNSSTGAALAGLLFRSSEVALNTSKSNTLTGGTNNNSYLGASPIYWQAAFVNWYGVEKGSLLADTATLTPTNGLHHVTGGATSVTTIATTNVPANQVARLTLIADGGSLTFATGGNIATGGTIAQNTAQDFMLDGSTWYPVQ